ncbi:uncharacterized [Tachysurus ichikawai]
MPDLNRPCNPNCSNENGEAIGESREHGECSLARGESSEHGEIRGGCNEHKVRASRGGRVTSSTETGRQRENFNGGGGWHPLQGRRTE